ncbi:MAG: glycosyltransferase [Puniceicoccaceae bacterium]
MFRLSDPPGVREALANFATGFDDRIAALRAGTCRIVFLYEARDFGSFRYRCYAPARILNRREAGVASWFFQDEIPLLEQALDGVERIVLARMPWSNSLDRLLARARARGIELVFDTDDLVFDSRHSPLICNILRTRNRIEADYWFAYVARRFVVADRCDRFLATNEFLADRVRDCFPEKECGVVPNFPTTGQVAVSESIHAEKTGSPTEGPFLAGYFSGSATHNDDFGMVESEVVDWLENDPDTRLRVVGYLDLSGRFDRLRTAGRVEVVEATDFLSLQKLIAECDVNLAPLLPGVFADCKSELKFFDAALVGTPTIASPTFAFRGVMRHGGNGFLCRQGEWAASLRALAAMPPSERGAVAERARGEVLRRYTGPDLEETVHRSHRRAGFVEGRGGQ